MHTRNKKPRYIIATVLFLSILIAAGGIIVYGVNKKANNPATFMSPQPETTTPEQPAPETAAPVFNSTQHTTTDPSSIWFIVNKAISLASTYQPADIVVPNVPLQSGKSTQEMSLRREPASALESMFAAAAEQGVQLKLASGYRSYDLQGHYYNSLVKSLGAEEANKVSAKPGTSEHQTGLAADIASYSNDVCHLETCFGTMAEGQWLANNAHTYGFIIRYPQSKTAITGYNYEPWHIRYVGKELAAELQKTEQTLEEFFNI